MRQKPDRSAGEGDARGDRRDLAGREHDEPACCCLECFAIGDLRTQLRGERPFGSIHAQTFTIGKKPNVQVAQIRNEL